MPILGFDSVADMFDGGGAGKSDPGNYSWEGTPFAGGGGGGDGGKKGGLLSGIGSLVGMAFGGPAGAAIGAGLGTLISGGSIGSALKSGAGSFLSGKFGGGAGNAMMSVLGGGGSPQDALSQLLGGGQQNFVEDQGPGVPGQPQGGGQGQGQGLGGGLMNLLGSPLVMAALLKATEPKNVELATPEQRRQIETGERLPEYQGTPAFDYRGYAKGGFIEGPGTGRSDSIPARIYQNGGPVREARLSDGEFVMTNKAVRGAGSGDRARGAAAMYRMMNDFEQRA